jgi:2-phosphosulfolactate phosphatase
MKTHIEVLGSPAEFEALSRRDLSEAVCVVFDILRATSSMITALKNGATEILPVADIPEALAIRARRPEVLLAGERMGLRIRAEQSGGTDFDLGNSPREFVSERVAGRSIVMTTTNGTRAMRSCGKAAAVLPASFLNLRATVRWVEARQPATLILVGSGTFEEASFEDTLAAGAFADAVWPMYCAGHVTDSAEIARHLYRTHHRDLLGAMQFARNGRRLLAHPDLHEDVRCCLQRETVGFCAITGPDGAVRVCGGPA